MSTTATTETPGAAAVPAKPSFGDIPLACIRASKTNPRTIFNEADLNDLATSIKMQGVAQPILVRPIETVGDVTYFEIVAGERRFRASGIAGMPTVPAIVRVLSDQAAYEIQVLENLQRVDLHPLEEAIGFNVMMSQYDVTADELAAKVGKSRAYIYASLKLCALVHEARQAFYAGLLTKSTALLVARIPVKALQVTCTKEITAGHSGQGVMSTRTAQDYISRRYMLSLGKAAFEPEDVTLCAGAGACMDCPKRAGNQPEIFTDVAADVCTDPVCFGAKGAAHAARSKQLAIASGKTVISGAAARKILPYQHHAPTTGYVTLDTRNYDDDKHRTHGQILGKDNAAIVLVESPHDGSLVAVAKLADIKKVMVEKGIGTRRLEESAASKNREKAQEEKAKREREYRKQMFLDIRDATLMLNLVDLDLRLIARQLFDRLPGGTIPTALVISLTGWTDATLPYPRDASLKAAVDALPPAQLIQFIRDCVLSRELDVNTYTSTGKDEPANLLAFAHRAKVDAKQIRSTIDAAAKDKADAKKKVTDKKAAPAVAAKVAAPAKAPAAKKAGTATAKPVPKVKRPAPADAAPIAPSASTVAWPFPAARGAARDTAGAK